MRIRKLRIESWILPVYLIQFLFLSTVSASCLYPNGTANPDTSYQPCSSDASNPLHTICCATGRAIAPGGVGETKDVCMPNGLCQNSVKPTTNAQVVTSYFRDACTEKDWTSGKCLNVCTDNVNLANVQLTPCDGTATSDKWCCGNTKDCCVTNPITLPSKFGVDDAVSASTTKISLLPPPPSSTHPLSSSVKTTTSKNPAATTGPVKSKESAAPKSSSLSGGAIAGIVIGVFVALALMFATGYYLASRRRRVYGLPLPREQEAGKARCSTPTPPEIVEFVPIIRHELPANEKPLELP